MSSKNTISTVIRPATCALCIALGSLLTPAFAGAPARSTPKSAPAPKAFDADAFNAAADTPLLKRGSRGDAVARAQILLDRAWYSTGEIDGRFAANMQRMVTAFQRSRGLPITGTVTPQTWNALRAQDNAPLLVAYQITERDAAGPFEKLPADMVERSRLKAMPYESIVEALAEKFHVSMPLLEQINRGRRAEAGTEIVVPNVAAGKPPAGAASIYIDKSDRVLFVLDNQRKPVAAFPISIGNEKSDPLPIGAMAIRNEVSNPSFTYNPGLLKNAPKDAPKVEIAPGPNNPVGALWLGLSKPHWGIHGTPEPSKVGHSETNGCIHLTNWDVQRLSTLAKAGFKVDVQP